jgi:hypothetical protein
MYSWCMTYEWCTARQLLYFTYLRSLAYACTYIYRYGTSKILLSLKKMTCYTVDIIIRNVAIQGLFSGSCFLLMPYIADSLRNNHQESLFDQRQLLSWHFSRQPRNTTSVRSMKENAMSNKSSSYSHCMSSVCRDSRSVNKLSAYEFSTYGTWYGEARYLLALIWTHFQSSCFS